MCACVEPKKRGGGGGGGRDIVMILTRITLHLCANYLIQLY